MARGPFRFGQRPYYPRPSFPGGPMTPMTVEAGRYGEIREWTPEQGYPPRRTMQTDESDWCKKWRQRCWEQARHGMEETLECQEMAEWCGWERRGK